MCLHRSTSTSGSPGKRDLGEIKRDQGSMEQHEGDSVIRDGRWNDSIELSKCIHVDGYFLPIYVQNIVFRHPFRKHSNLTLKM